MEFLIIYEIYIICVRKIILLPQFYARIKNKDNFGILEQFVTYSRDDFSFFCGFLMTQDFMIWMTEAFLKFHKISLILCSKKYEKEV